jgi:putative membrane protein
MMVLLGSVMMLGLVIAAIVIVRSATGSSDGPQSQTEADPLDTARRIASERYARGELTSEEYRERMEISGQQVEPCTVDRESSAGGDPLLGRAVGAQHSVNPRTPGLLLGPILHRSR